MKYLFAALCWLVLIGGFAAARSAPIRIEDDSDQNDTDSYPAFHFHLGGSR